MFRVLQYHLGLCGVNLPVFLYSRVLANQAMRPKPHLGLAQQLLDANGGITIGDADAPCTNPFEFWTNSAYCLDVLLPGQPLPTPNNINNYCGISANGITINSFLWHVIALTMNVYNTGYGTLQLGNLSCQIDYSGTGLTPENTIQDLLDVANTSYACHNFNSALIEAMTTLNECKNGCEEDDFGGAPIAFRNTTDGGPQVEIFPNPTTNVFYIKMGELQEKAVNLRIFNQVGTLVLERQIEVGSASPVSIELPRHQLPSGFYYLHLNTEDFSVIKNCFSSNKKKKGARPRSFLF